jgi:uncharacterized membrane protein YoaK (UPF0700 family)
LLSRLQRNRARLNDLILVTLLPAVAGAVNASGFFAVGVYTSHMSGSTARIGDELAAGNRAGALQAASMVFAFFVGAAVATALIDAARRLSQARYMSALLLEAAALTAFAVATLHMGPQTQGMTLELAWLLCFAMGAQNAMVTRISRAEVRTTHVTGIVTDLGIESVRAVQWLVQAARRQGPGLGARGLFELLRSDPELQKLRLHLNVYGAFVAGAAAGPMIWLRLGGASLLLPVAVLLCLALFDGAFGLDHASSSQQVVPAAPAGAPAARPEAPRTAPAALDFAERMRAASEANLAVLARAGLARAEAAVALFGCEPFAPVPRAAAHAAALPAAAPREG